MPTILRVGSYRFFFYSNENHEPPHIHVESGDATAKFWLDRVVLANDDGFKASDLRKIQAIIEENCDLLLRAYKEYHG